MKDIRIQEYDKVDLEVCKHIKINASETSQYDECDCIAHLRIRCTVCKKTYNFSSHIG